MLRDLQFAIRMLLKQPGFSLIATLTLALGIGATSAVFSLIQGVLLTPPPYEKPEQLVLIPTTRTDGQKMDSPRGWAAQQWMDWQKDAKSFEGIAAYDWTFNFLIRNDGSQSMQGMEVTKNYFQVMELKAAAGRGFDDSDFGQGPVKSILLGYEFWQRAFGGDKQIIGKTVRISRWDVTADCDRGDGTGRAILAVAGSGEGAELRRQRDGGFLGAGVSGPEEFAGPYWDVVARLRDGVTPQHAQQELSVLMAGEALAEKKFEGFGPQLEPVTEEMNRDGERILLPLLGAAGLVLLIACGNVAALLLVRGLQRQQEYAVRSAMGMGRMALLRQVLTESLLLAVVGGAFGGGLAFGAVKLFKAIAGHAVPRLDGVTAGWAVLGWGLGVAVLAAFCCGNLAGAASVSVGSDGGAEERGPKGTAGTARRRFYRESRCCRPR